MRGRWDVLLLAIALLLGAAAVALGSPLDPGTGFGAAALALGAALGVRLLRVNRRLERTTIEATERAHQLGILLETSRRLSATLDPQALACLLARQAVALTDAPCCRVALADEGGGAMRIAAGSAAPAFAGDLELGARLDPEAVAALVRAASACGPTGAVAGAPVPVACGARGRAFPLRHGAELLGILLVGEPHATGRVPIGDDRVGVCRALADQAAVALARVRSLARAEATALGTIAAMGAAIDAKSRWTHGHSQRVAGYASAIAEEIRLSEPVQALLRLGCLLHDVGKIGIADAILDKPGPLDDDEYEAMKRHPQLGVEILAPVLPLRDVLPIVRHHHERWDGRGYPDGLGGEDIPMLARIAAVADAYDSMTARRPYRESPGHERARLELRKGAGSQFDPRFAEVLLDLGGALEDLAPGRPGEGTP